MLLKWCEEALRWVRGQYTCLLGFCGTDGCLLTPAVPARAEKREDIEAVLKPLLVSRVKARVSSGLSIEESLPGFISTDVFEKHCLKQQKLVREVAEQLRGRPVGCTPKGSVARGRGAYD